MPRDVWSLLTENCNAFTDNLDLKFHILWFSFQQVKQRHIYSYI